VVRVVGSRARVVGTLALVVALAGCATAFSARPFEVPEEQVHGRVRRIARAPLLIAPRLGVADSTKARLQALIDEKHR
jgi:hypothetical protein